MLGQRLHLRGRKTVNRGDGLSRLFVFDDLGHPLFDLRDGDSCAGNGLMNRL